MPYLIQLSGFDLLFRKIFKKLRRMLRKDSPPVKQPLKDSREEKKMKKFLKKIMMVEASPSADNKKNFQVVDFALVGECVVVSPT